MKLDTDTTQAFSRLLESLLSGRNNICTSSRLLIKVGSDISSISTKTVRVLVLQNFQVKQDRPADPLGVFFANSREFPTAHL